MTQKIVHGTSMSRASPKVLNFFIALFSFFAFFAAHAAPPESVALEFMATQDAFSADRQVSQIIVKLARKSSADEDAPISTPQLGRIIEIAQVPLTFVRVTRTGGQVLGLPQAMSTEDAKAVITRLQLSSNILWAELLYPNDIWLGDQSDSAALTPEELTDQIIVKLSGLETQRASDRNEPLLPAMLGQLSQIAGVQFRHVRAMSGGAHVLAIPSKMKASVAKAIAVKLEADPSVKYADPVLTARPMLVPNDQYYPLQWHYFEPVGGINLPAAWDVTTGSSNIVVAVVDTGILFQHPDLIGRTLPGYDMISDVISANDGDGRDADATDPGDWRYPGECGTSIVKKSTWHGTHVAGTIGAASNNGIGVAGINWNSKILPVRVLGKCGGSSVDIGDGIRWAAGLPVPGVPSNPNPAKVINLSLGGYMPCPSTYQSAISDAIASGAVVVVAAGNGNPEGSPTNAATNTPANCNGVITVAANNRNGDKATYSNFGSTVAISAPGGETSTTSRANAVLSTINAGTNTAAAFNYDYDQGTSMAAPHVSGIASLMLSVNPLLTPAQMKVILQSTSRHFVYATACGWYGGCGEGISDAGAAVRGATAPATYLALPYHFYDAQNQPWLFYTGSQVVGSTSSSIAINVVNLGMANLNITSITRSGDFNGSTNCTAANLAPGASCAMSISFLPTGVGVRTGTIAINDNSYGSPHIVKLYGTGVSASSPAVTLSDTNITFNSQVVGTTSASQTITVTNSGNALLNIGSVSGVGDFGGTTTCLNAVLASGANCQIYSAFSPTAVGSRSGTITINDNAPGGPHVISLSGTGLGSPAVSLSATNINFDNQTVGTRSTPQAITLTNSGTATLYLYSVTGIGDFGGTMTCGSSLAPGENCALYASFTPSAAGVRNGSVSISDNASSSPHVVNFSGVGVAAGTSTNYSGIFYSPSESGWGISVTHHPSPSNIIFAAWYTYGPSGMPTWYVISSCPLANNSCTGDVYKTTGTPLGKTWNSSSLTVTKAGQGTLAFSDKNNATFSYTIDGISGVKSVTQQIFATGTALPIVNYTDIWYNPGESGWGVSITHQYDMAFVAWYTYDANSNPNWYVASACAMTADNKSCTGDVYQTAGTYFGAPWNQAKLNVGKVGTMSIRFIDATDATFTYIVNGVANSKPIVRQGF